MTTPKPIEIPQPGAVRDALVDRLFSRIDRPNGFAECWLWTGHQDRGGYGEITVMYRKMRVHRLMYTLTLGPIPEGLELDHLCRNRACCNPLDLEPVTHAVNTSRGERALKTHCVAGHPFNELNTVHLTVRGRPTRQCVTCRRARSRAAYRRLAELLRNGAA